jgi:RNA polymerase sigma-70 factor (ECF subfamily)
MADFELPDQLRDETRAAWHRYLDVLSPFRPQLHRFCRRLTGDIWEAEDLLQDTILRGFGVLGSLHHTIRNPRGYLLRIATNSWFDALRRRDLETRTLPATTADEFTPADPAEVRGASTRLLQLLAPQERAAVVMKEVFDMSLEEIAQVLGTTVGGVKAALHRGRSHLRDSQSGRSPRRTPPAEAIVKRFVELLNGSDLKGLLELMLDTGTVEMPGSLVETGRNEFERKGSWFWHAVHVHPELPPEKRPVKFVNETALFENEPLVLSFAPGESGRLLAAVTRLEESGGRITRVRCYQFCPETVAEVGEALGLTVASLPYRFLTPAPGQYWAAQGGSSPDSEGEKRQK